MTVIIKPKNSSVTRELTVIPYVDMEESKEPQSAGGLEGLQNPARLGVYLGSTAYIHYDTVPQKLTAGFLHSYNILAYTVATMGNLVDLSVREGTAEPLTETVSGPVGIYSIVDNIVSYSGKQAFMNLIDLMGLISVSLAFLNILPLPALDGGRIFFILLEVIRRKKVNPNFEAKVHQFGMLALLSFLVLITIRDVTRIF